MLLCCWNRQCYRKSHLHNLFMIMGHKDTKMAHTFVDHLNSYTEKGGEMNQPQAANKLQAPRQRPAWFWEL